VIGLVVMPEHIHLLISEPEKGDPSIVMQALKQAVARRPLRKARKKSASQIALWEDRQEPFGKDAFMISMCSRKDGWPASYRLGSCVRSNQLGGRVAQPFPLWFLCPIPTSRVPRSRAVLR